MCARRDGSSSWHRRGLGRRRLRRRDHLYVSLEPHWVDRTLRPSRRLPCTAEARPRYAAPLRRTSPLRQERNVNQWALLRDPIRPGSQPLEARRSVNTWTVLETHESAVAEAV